MKSKIKDKIMNIKLDSGLKTPLYLQFKDELKGILSNAGYPQDIPLPSLREMEKSLSISFLTISKAVNGLVEEGILRTEIGKGIFSTGKNNIVKLNAGLIVSNVKLKMFEQTINGVSTVLAEEGLGVVIHHSPDSKAFIRKMINENKVCGFIIFGDHLFNDDEFIDEIIQKIPLVALNVASEVKADAFVHSDDREGMQAIVDALAEKGHKKVTMLASEEHISTGVLRTESFKELASKKGIDFTIIENVRHYEDDGYLNAMRVFNEYKDSTAIVCWNDNVAAGAIDFLRKQGVEIPSKMAVTGYGNLEFANKLHPRLTTVEQHFDEMGETAARLLLEANQKRTYKNPIKAQIPTKLILRETL